jgi:predicted nucleic acid-binding protein
MAYLLDSDIVIDHLAGDNETGRMLAHLSGEGLFISIVTYMEVYQGIMGSADPVRVEMRFLDMLNGLPVVPFSAEAAVRCARLRNELQQQGRRVRSRILDLLNAAMAVENDLTMVTRNLRDYRDIPGLVIYTIPSPSSN